MLLEQNAALRQRLSEAQAELRAIRIEQLGARARDGLTIPHARDVELDDTRKQRDASRHRRPARPPLAHPVRPHQLPRPLRLDPYSGPSTRPLGDPHTAWEDVEEE